MTRHRAGRHPVPPAVRADAVAALELRLPDTAVLPLTHDSLLDDDARWWPRRLRFEGQARRVDLLVTGHRQALVLDVLVTPDDLTTVEVVQPRTWVRGEEARRGRHVLVGLVEGPTSVVVRGVDSACPAVRTAWVLL